MRSLPLTEFILLYPNREGQSVHEIYKTPFFPRQILDLFEDWEYFEEYGCYIDKSEERNMVWFGESGYCINGSLYRKPATVNEFIKDCQRNQIYLRWKESVADRLWGISQIP